MIAIKQATLLKVKPYFYRVTHSLKKHAIKVLKVYYTAEKMFMSKKGVARNEDLDFNPCRTWRWMAQNTQAHFITA
jgi:hypothetical protein